MERIRAHAAKIPSLIRLREESDAEVVREQRQTLLNRTYVIGGIGLLVMPFTILSYLAELRPDGITVGLAISVCADLATILLVLAMRRGVFNEYYHLPMFIFFGLICGVTEAIMLQLTGGAGTSLFFFPYYLIFFGLATLFPARLQWIVLISLTLVIGYAVSEAIGGNNTPRSLVVANVIHLIDYMLITCIGNRVITHLFVRERYGRLQLERANERLKEVDRIKTEFFANVSHELRTPLTLVLAPIASLMRGEHGAIDPLQRSMLDTVQRSASRLLVLINDLLLLSKLDAGKVERRRDMVDVLEICDRVVGAFTVYAEQLHLFLEWHRPMGSCHWHGDPSHLERALINLLSNACKFSREHGRVRVRLEMTDNDLTVSVEDEGIGIAESDLARIFRRFEQVESAPNRRFEGSGIGLAIVQELVHLYGGAIDAKSVIDRGSTFSITMPRAATNEDDDTNEFRSNSVTASLPQGQVLEVGMAALTPMLAQPRSETTPELVESIEPRGVPGQPIVLVLEDNVELLRYLELELVRHYRVVAFSDSRVGLQYALATPPDLVLSDIMMPYVDGLEVARRLKANAKTRTMPVILLSARSDLDTKLTGFSINADDFVSKPFQFPELKARIDLHLRVRSYSKVLEEQASHLLELNDRLTRAFDQLKHSEAALLQNEKIAALGTVVAGVAHEINNPLHFIKGNMSILRRRFNRLVDRSGGSAAATEELDGIFADIDGSLDRITAVTRELYLFARRDANVREPVDIEDLVNTVVKVLGTQIKPGVRIMKTFADQKIVHSNPQALFQVVMNLLQNAIHAVGEEGEIVVQSMVDDGKVRLDVKDSGCGIAPEHLPHIFEPFFTTKPVGEGTGLGLSIVHNLVSQIQGRIHVESAPNAGTKFTIEIPRG